LRTCTYFGFFERGEVAGEVAVGDAEQLLQLRVIDPFIHGQAQP
jgi:hypothetical protein